MMPIQSIFFANSTYSLYQYALMFPDKMEKTLFFCGPAIKNIQVNNKVFLDCSKKTKDQTADYEHQLIKIVDSIVHAMDRINLYVNLSTPHAHCLLGVYPITALSDGLSDLKLFPQYETMPEIIQGYPTILPDNFEADQQHKTTYVNLKQLWHENSAEVHQMIAKLFNVPENYFAALKDKKIVLVTQPLSEDGIVSEEEKVRLYKTILSQYNMNDVVIKPHPRENTDWTGIFPDTPVIPRQIAAEMLPTLLQFEKAVTFYSTAVLSMGRPDQIDFYSKDFCNLNMVNPKELLGGMPFNDMEKEGNRLHVNVLRIPDHSFYHIDVKEIDTGRNPLKQIEYPHTR